MQVSSVKWISVWCRKFTVDFGHLIFPEGFRVRGKIISNYNFYCRLCFEKKVLFFKWAICLQLYFLFAMRSEQPGSSDIPTIFTSTLFYLPQWYLSFSSVISLWFCCRGRGNKLVCRTICLVCRGELDIVAFPVRKYRRIARVPLIFAKLFF